jgi:glycosyltransferase involved in cell wall biosynthesis
MARHASVPVVSTLHGRLDTEGMPELLDEFADIPLVAISESQRRWAPDANWLGVVHNGLPLDGMPVAEPRDYLAFVGRIAREKGVAEAIDLADRVRLQLKMAAKIIDAEERRLFDTLVRPALDDGRVAFLGELPPSSRDPLMAAARATLMLGAWPEPFGLVAIESLAAGTPVIARRAGALPEIIEHGIDGYLVDDVDEAVQAVRMLGRLDRARIRRRALARFTPARMADRYEEIYRELIAGSAGTPVPMAAGEATGVARVGRETEASATVVVR